MVLLFYTISEVYTIFGMVSHQHRDAAYPCVVFVRSCVPNMPCRRRKTERFQGQFFRAHGRPRRKSHAACNGRKCDFQTFSRYEMKRCLRQCDYESYYVKGSFYYLSTYDCGSFVVI